MAYPYDPTQGGPISKNTAAEWIQRYQDFTEVKAHFFGAEHINNLLKQPGCVGMRIYHAMDETGKRQVLLVGVREDGSNIWPKNSSDPNTTEGMVLDMGMPCPPWCPPNN